MKTALLIIDMQRALCSGEEAAFEVDTLIEKVNTLDAELVERRVPIDLTPTLQSWGNREMYVRDADGNGIRFVQGTSE